MSGRIVGNQYSAISIEGGSIAHLGDVHNYHSGPTPHVAHRVAEKLLVTDLKLDRAALVTKKGDRVDGTCTWILEDKAFLTWLHGNSGVLWITGGPGKGKTVLSFFLTEHLAQHHDVAYFFCTFQDDRRNSASVILRGILFQIVKSHPSLAGSLGHYFENDKRADISLDSIEALWDMLATSMSILGDKMPVCLIDGLDECDQDSVEFLSGRIKQLCNSTGSGNFRLIIVSRDLKGFEKCVRIKLDPDSQHHVNSDIELFVRSRVTELSGLPGCKDTFLEMIAKKMLQRSEGTFLWAGFAMNELLRQSTCLEVRETLEELPVGLTAMYGRMIRNINPKRRPRAAFIVRCVVTALRPLTLLELARILDLWDEDVETSQAAVLDYLKICGPLFAVSKNEVGLVHQSAVEYLLRDTMDTDTVLEAFRVQPAQGHLDMLQNCVRVMEEESHLSDHLKDATSLEFIAEEYYQAPMLKYALYYWHEHAARVPARLDHIFSANFFQEGSITRHNAVLMHAEEAETSSVFYLGADNGQYPLHTACFFGIIPWVAEQLKQTVSLGPGEGIEKISAPGLQRGGSYTPLMIAAEVANSEVVRVLLDSGADVNAISSTTDHPTAVHAAATHENPDTMKTLLSYGADPNVQDAKGKVALDMAIKWRYRSANVDLLLAHKADISKASNKTRDALRLEALSGSTEMQGFLHAQGFQWSLDNWESDEQLPMAVRALKLPIIEALASRGANISRDWRDDLGLRKQSNDALKAMALQILLDAGADPNTVDRNAFTMLHDAARANLPQCTTVLVKAGVDPNAQTTSIISRPKKDLNTLEAALASFIRLQIMTEDHVAAGHLGGATALHLAVEWGASACIGLLLDAGADLRASNVDGTTALHFACISGNDHIVAVLIKAGADVHAIDKQGRTALHYASRKRSAACAQIVLENGGDVHAVDIMGSTALHDACHYRSDACIALLLKAGANALARTREGDTMLHKAALSWSPTCVRRILQLEGTDVNTKNFYGEAALHSVQRTDRQAFIKEEEFDDDTVEVVRILLQAGADMNDAGPDKYQKTPLQAWQDSMIWPTFRAMLEEHRRWKAGQGVEIKKSSAGSPQQ